MSPDDSDYSSVDVGLFLRATNLQSLKSETCPPPFNLHKLCQ
jgi:hypothetical protein